MVLKEIYDFRENFEEIKMFLGNVYLWFEWRNE